jgi:hypothetical protein
LSADTPNVPMAKKTTEVAVDLNQSTNEISMKKKQDATIVVLLAYCVIQAGFGKIMALHLLLQKLPNRGNTVVGTQSVQHYLQQHTYAVNMRSSKISIPSAVMIYHVKAAT